jgi:hypothetical protein
VSTKDLLEQLSTMGVLINDAARTLFASSLFTTLKQSVELTTVELSVLELGFAQGATFPELHRRAEHVGLELPPVELGPHLRLMHSTQKEGHSGFPATQHKAPHGSITIASAPLTSDDSFPKGFYLRRIDGTLWLRGYTSDMEHVWSPEDRLVFCTSSII